MHTSAPDAEPLSYTGTLLRAAEVRAKVLDHDGHTVPVLCVEIEQDCPLHTRVYAEQPFPPNHHTQAAAAARRLKKGMVITIDAPAVGLRLVATNVSHIHTHQPAADAAPTLEQADPCPKLF